MATASTTPPAAGSAAEQELLSQLVAAFEPADLQRLISLMIDDAWLCLPHTASSGAFGLLVIATRDDRVSAITRFDNAVIGPFGFPRTLAD